MEIKHGNLGQLSSVSKRFVKRVLMIGENRVELLLVELQEERERLLLAILLAMGIAAFGLLAGVGITLMVTLAFWDHSPIIAVLILTALYLAMAGLLYRRLVCLKRDWQILSSTMDQLRKDRVCLERTLN